MTLEARKNKRGAKETGAAEKAAPPIELALVAALTREANRCSASPARVKAILSDAGSMEGLALEEAAMLLSVEDPSLTSLVIEKADEVRRSLFQDLVPLFAPLYISNHCRNGCLYCGFGRQNDRLPRKALGTDEILKEAKYLESRSIRRLLLVLGEDPRWGADYIAEQTAAILTNTSIEEVHVNAPPMDTSDLVKIRESGAALFQVFQETYHKDTYEKMHPVGVKKDFSYRLTALDRALAASFPAVGMGALFGLYDYRYDALATIAHARHLLDTYDERRIGISVPRHKRAEGSALVAPPAPVSDAELTRAVAVYRLALPGASITVSTREMPALRSALLHSGATQMSAASCTEPGGYTRSAGDEITIEQFETSDNREVSEIVAAVSADGFVPAFSYDPADIPGTRERALAALEDAGAATPLKRQKA